MRPVFNELLTQLQRSIGYFSNLDRTAKISRIVALGNAMKLPGLRRYLAQSLGYDIERVQSFQGLVGSQVLSSPVFKENAICYGICYGLTLQGLGKPGLHTNLLPKEIVKDRLIKGKKPWAVAAVALLLLGCGVSFGAYALAMKSVDKGEWKSAVEKADSIASDSGRLKSEADAAKSSFQSTDQIGQHLVGNVEGRIRWLELMRAVNQCLSRNEAAAGTSAKDTEEAPKNTDSNALAKEITDRDELHIVNLECQYCEDVSTWFSGVKQWYHGPDVAAQSGGGSAEASPAAPADAPATGDQSDNQANLAGPKGSGWIVKLEGYHFHNNMQKSDIGALYVQKMLIDKLLNSKVKLPNGDGDKEEAVSMRELGITYPVLVGNPKRVEDYPVDNPYASAESGAGGPRITNPVSDTSAGQITLRRFNFVVHFCWQPKSYSERRAVLDEAKKAQPTPGGEQQ